MTKKECSLHFLPAGQGDCFVIQFQDNSLNYHNILIDGGNRKALEFKKQKKQLLKIIEHGKKGRFDLVVVTHSDDDHIKGILNLVADDEIESYVDEYWFNSEKTIAKLIGKPFKKTQKYPVNKHLKGAVKSSRQQDYDLYSILENNKKWNQKVITDAVVADVNGLKINVLSPSIDKLQSLNNYWPTQSLKKGAIESSGKCEFDYDLSIEELKMKLPYFEQDESKVNGGSIAFLIEYHDFKWLFLSDSHPDIIVENLRKLLPVGGSQLKLDVIKLSHHGSKKNTSDDLLGLIESQNFVVSANANKIHCHPHKEALVRVLDHVGIEKTNFFFVNKNKDIERIFAKSPSIKTHYPNSKEEGVIFIYEY
ncbi:hypothetical protein KO527_02675 [Pseudoalteromonas sp. C2R02]|uniref:ComEC/Rec2 family competence protein n=1 Tax=Pseudoalteromonas sp. C2R02 TaxID=2841565 RepID=UPI001C080D04|nr:hypothetical protein [Pseudoalteromonas sp. C2R02]MBU2968260.1 hypothetical protein [Pseudoalteromonas sp. C2R02]